MIKLRNRLQKESKNRTDGQNDFICLKNEINVHIKNHIS